MKKIIFSQVLLATILVINSFIYSQSVHTITVADFSFTPDNITVVVGDTVRWVYNTGATEHNIVADDGSFTSGPLALPPWTYDHVFSAAGNNPYYCELHGGPGGQGMSGVVIVQNPSGVPGEELIANKFELKQNYPNPFNPSTKINFVIPQESFVSIKVFDVIGNEITTLINEVKKSGSYEVEFVADKLPSGVYVYQLRADNFIQTRKMILLR